MVQCAFLRIFTDQKSALNRRSFNVVIQIIYYAIKSNYILDVINFLLLYFVFL